MKKQATYLLFKLFQFLPIFPAILELSCQRSFYSSRLYVVAGLLKVAKYPEKGFSKRNVASCDFNLGYSEKASMLPMFSRKSSNSLGIRGAV